MLPPPRSLPGAIGGESRDHLPPAVDRPAKNDEVRGLAAGPLGRVDGAAIGGPRNQRRRIPYSVRHPRRRVPTSVIGAFTVPASALAMHRTRTATPGMTVEIERVVAHESGTLTPYF